MSLRLGLPLMVMAMVATCRTYDVVYTSDGGQCPSVCPTNPCSDPLSDRLNCGGCGVQCTANELCEALGSPPTGTCVPCPQADETVCGTGGAAFCTNLTSDDQNCGACDFRCAHPASCQKSQCVCSLTTCSGDGGVECVDTQSDVSHCGGCDIACPLPAPNETAVCLSGNCSQQCVAPFADCDGIGANGCEANLQSSATNCGACGRTCNGGTCASGMCPITTYATGSQLRGLAVDSSFVYWAMDVSTGGIFKTPIGVVAPQSVYSTPTATILGVDSTRVAWMSGTSQLDSVLLSGGTATSLASLVNGITMVLAGGYVYFSTNDTKVSRVPSDGSTGAVTLTTSVDALALAVDTTNVYFAGSDGAIYFVPVTAQNASPTFFANAAGATSLAFDVTNVYWAAATGDLMLQPKSSTVSKTIASTGQTQSALIATDGLDVYWANADGSIHRVAVIGGTPLTLTPTGPSVVALAVDATNVYWTGAIVGSTAK